MEKIENLQQNEQSSQFKLGPRMLQSVVERLETTLNHYRYCSPFLSKVDEELLEAADNGDLTELTLTEIVWIIEKYTDNCELVKKMHENLVRDIYMRSKHYRKWRGDVLYLSDHLVQSSGCVTVDSMRN